MASFPTLSSQLFSASCTIFRANLKLSQADSQSSPRYSLQQQEAPDGVVILVPTAQVFIFCHNTWDMLNTRQGNGWFLDMHHEIWYTSECYRFWFSFTNHSSWSSGPYTEVVSWFLVHFSVQTACEFLKLLLFEVLQALSLLCCNRNQPTFFFTFLWKIIEAGKNKSPSKANQASYKVC